MEQLQLKGRTVAVTGASGGIGQALCRGFADRGARVTPISRRYSTASRQHPSTWDPGAYDVCVLGAAFGMLHRANTPILTTDFDDMMQVNTIQTIKDAQAALAAGAIHVHLISSIIGVVSSPFYSLYAASKYALRGWAYGAARELPGRVSISYPNGTDTAYFANIRGEQDLLDMYGGQVAEARHTYDTAADVASGIIEGITWGGREIIPTTFALDWFMRNDENIMRMWYPGLERPSVEKWDWWEQVTAQVARANAHPATVLGER